MNQVASCFYEISSRKTSLSIGIHGFNSLSETKTLPTRNAFLQAFEFKRRALLDAVARCCGQENFLMVTSAQVVWRQSRSHSYHWDV